MQCIKIYANNIYLHVQISYFYQYCSCEIVAYAYMFLSDFDKDNTLAQLRKPTSSHEQCCGNQGIWLPGFIRKLMTWGVANAVWPL